MSEASAVNARGDVVGLSSTADFSAIHATLWHT
jgi:probable HAF family extracellular repeat protein